MEAQPQNPVVLQFFEAAKRGRVTMPILADLVGVQRSTLYGWRRNAFEPSPQHRAVLRRLTRRIEKAVQDGRLPVTLDERERIRKVLKK